MTTESSPNAVDLELNRQTAQQSHKRKPIRTSENRPIAQKLSVVFCNARSVYQKMPELAERVRLTSPDCIAVTESWLKNSDPDRALSLPVHRRDRQEIHKGSGNIRRGGGVAVWVRSEIKCSRRRDLELWSEDLWLEFPNTRSSRRSVLLGCAYRPPDSLITDFCSALELFFSKIDPITHEIILLGDFNATSPKWLSSDSYNKAGRHLEPFTLQMGLDQFVSSPTHFTADGRCTSCLDLVFCSNRHLVSNICTISLLGKSDHTMLSCTFNVEVNRSSFGSRLTRI